MKPVKILTTLEAHESTDFPEQGEEIYVCSRDNLIRLCIFSGGVFCIDNYSNWKPDEILWWTRDIVFDDANQKG